MDWKTIRVYRAWRRSLFSCSVRKLWGTLHTSYFAQFFSSNLTTRRVSRAVPHPSTYHALCCLTSIRRNLWLNCALILIKRRLLTNLAKFHGALSSLAALVSLYSHHAFRFVYHAIIFVFLLILCFLWTWATLVILSVWFICKIKIQATLRHSAFSFLVCQFFLQKSLFLCNIFVLPNIALGLAEGLYRNRRIASF